MTRDARSEFCIFCADGCSSVYSVQTWSIQLGWWRVKISSIDQERTRKAPAVICSDHSCCTYKKYERPSMGLARRSKLSWISIFLTESLRTIYITIICLHDTENTGPARAYGAESNPRALRAQWVHAFPWSAPKHYRLAWRRFPTWKNQGREQTSYAMKAFLVFASKLELGSLSAVLGASRDLHELAETNHFSRQGSSDATPFTEYADEAEGSVSFSKCGSLKLHYHQAGND